MVLGMSMESKKTLMINLLGILSSIWPGMYIWTVV